MTAMMKLLILSLFPLAFPTAVDSSLDVHELSCLGKAFGYRGEGYAAHRLCS